MSDALQKSIEIYLADEAATLGLGEAIAQGAKPPVLIFLEGDLGAGKTTLSRGLLRGLGHTGSVKSPTYTIVEPYQIAECGVYHFDLYRLGDPEELEYLGLRDYLQEQAIVLIEWPERGGAWLPEPDLIVQLRPDDEGRIATLTARTEHGLSVIAHLRL